MSIKSLFRKAVTKPSETQINANMEVYAICEDGRLLAVSTSLAAAGMLQGEFPQADLLVVEIDDMVWQSLEKRTEETISELSR